MKKNTLFTLSLILFLSACDENKDGPLSGTKWFNESDVVYIEFTDNLLKDYEYDGESCYDYYEYNYSVDGDHFSIMAGEVGNEFTFDRSGDLLTIIDLGDNDTIVFVSYDFDATEFSICNLPAMAETELFVSK